jgi:MYXO-CTERM domain-containing protein
MTRSILAAAAAAALLLCDPSEAAIVQYDLRDLGRFEDFVADSGAGTYTGTGFLGMYNDRWTHRGVTWSHAFDLARPDDGRTLMQLDLAPLAGQRVVSATLSFRILDAEPFWDGTRFRITGFDNGDGRLGMTWDAPTDALGQVEHALDPYTPATQRFDVAALIQAALASDVDWLGLHLQNTDGGPAATYTYQFLEDELRSVIDLDRAQVRLEVITADVPEPAGWALGLTALAALAGTRRRASPRNRNAAA